MTKGEWAAPGLEVHSHFGVAVEKAGDGGDGGCEDWGFFGVDEIAPLPIFTVALHEEGLALFGLVFAVLGVILAEFLGAVGELAFVAVGARTLLHELLAELGLLLDVELGGGGLFEGGAVVGIGVVEAAKVVNFLGGLPVVVLPR